MRCCSFALVVALCCSGAQAQRRALLEGLFAPAPAPATGDVSATGWTGDTIAQPPSDASTVPAKTPRANQTPPGSPAPPPPPPPPPPIYYAPWVSPAAQASAPATASPSTPSTPSEPTSPSASSTPSTPSTGYTPPVSASAPVGSGAPAPSGPTSTPVSTMPAPGPQAAGKTSSAANVPAVSAVVVLPNYVLQTFDTAAQAQFIKAIEAAYPLNNVAVKINSISPGSVVVNETTTFLDGDTMTATNSVAALTTSPQDIFHPIDFGNVTVSNVTMGNVTNPGAATSSPTHTPASGAGQFAVASASLLVGAFWLVTFAM